MRKEEKMSKSSFFLAGAILITLWIITGQQVVYGFESSRFASPCPSFESSVMLWRKQESGSYVIGNGVYIGESAILTNRHLASEDLSIKTVAGPVDDVEILRIVTHPDLDLAVLRLSGPLPIPIVSWSGDVPIARPPYIVSGLRDGLNFQKYAGNHYKVVDLDQFLSRHQAETMIVFSNQATTPGDSGGALLDNSCRLVGLVTGGNHNLIGNLRPNSFYINLLNEETLIWIFEALASS